MSKNNFYLQSPETSTSSLSRNPSQPHSRNTSKSSTVAAAAAAAQQQSPRKTQHTSYAQSHVYHNDDYYDSDSDDDTSLPFPAPLPRTDFLSPTFDPSTYLSTLASTRYQTLEDLRTELRTRTQTLNQELLELVNAHHEDFIGLGRSLQGGEDKIEEVRVGVLGFRREIQDVRTKLKEREEDVEAMLETRKRVRKEIEVGRQCVDFEERVGLLERGLGITPVPGAGAGAGDAAPGENTDSEDDDDDDDDDGGDEDALDSDNDEDDDLPMSIAKITRRVRHLVGIEHQAERIGPTHPFIAAQQHRLEKLRSTLLLDLGAVLKRLQALDTDNSTRSGGSSKAAERKLRILELYRAIDASKEAVEILKG